MEGIIGRKLGMTQLFGADGVVTPVTVIEAGPCPVVQVRAGGEGRPARVQLGFEAAKKARAGKARLGHAAKAGLEAAPRVLREFAVPGCGQFSPASPAHCPPRLRPDTLSGCIGGNCRRRRY